MARVVQIVILNFIILLLTSCNSPEESKPIWEEAKLCDIAPPGTYQPSPPQLLKTINFDVHIIEIPADSIGKLNSVWNSLYARPIRFISHYAFSANSFIVRFGQTPMWNKIDDMLVTAGGQRALKISLFLSNNQTNDLTIAGLEKQQSILYVSSDGSSKKATVGPGMLVLRIKTVKVPGSRGECVFVAQPVFTQPIGSSIPALANRSKLHEFIFSSAAFGLKMSPGDFVVLGPEKYDSSRSTLGSLLFNKPEGSLFFDKTMHKKFEHKPVVKVFLLICTGISD